MLVAWLFARHVLWRDEVRAFSLALSGAGLGDMLQNIHGEGHPAVWYLILRLSHDLVATHAVMRFDALFIAIAALGIFAFRSPFRIWVVALVLFSLFGALDYPVIARNYGISALVMFALAALYPAIKDRPWFGLLVALLANTNVPSAILAGAFLLFRFVEMLADHSKPGKHDWLVFLCNAALALLGAILCFVVVYPPLNDGAVSLNYGHVGALAVVSALADAGKGFSNLVLNARGYIPPILLWASCLAFIRRPPALVAALAALAGLKLFFFFVYPSAYRHEALFIVFLLALFWIDATRTSGRSGDRPFTKPVHFVGVTAFVVLLGAQTLDLAKPLFLEAKDLPYSRSADVARILERPELKRAIVLADPDLMLEPLPYYVANPLWFLREEEFGTVFAKTRAGRERISLDDILLDAGRLHRRYRRPVVILLHLDLQDGRTGVVQSMYRDSTLVTGSGVRNFLAATHLLARLRPAISDEQYDVYLYDG